MRLIPDSHGLREYNHCHAPAGSPAGGQFCSGTDGVSTARDDTPEYGSKDYPTGTLLHVSKGSGFQKATFAVLKTTDGWRRVNNLTTNRGKPAGQVGDSIDLKDVQVESVLQRGLAGGEHPASIFDFAALPSGTVVRSNLGKTYTKVGDEWESETGTKVKYFHFDEGTYKVVKGNTAKDDTPEYGDSRTRSVYNRVAMRLNHTETRIMDRLRDRPGYQKGRTSVETYHGRGGDGGSVSGGKRLYDASASLADKGLVTIKSAGSHIVYKNGHGIHVYEREVRITPKGQEWLDATKPAPPRPPRKVTYGRRRRF